jgi:multidrug efflux pump subunit AcrB
MIYILLVYETGSYQLPGIIMLSIPLTLIGIMPGFWLLNVLTNHPVGGYENPVFFTATAMIGMIALGGIVVRTVLCCSTSPKTASPKDCLSMKPYMKREPYACAPSS